MNLQHYGFDFSYWALQTVAMMVTCFLIPRLTVKGPIPAFATVAALGFINSHWWNAALFLKIPATLTSQALLLVLTNGLIFWIVVKIIPGIEVRGILPAIAAPIVFTFCSLFVGQYGSQLDWNKVWQETSGFISHVRSFFEGGSSDAASSAMGGLFSQGSGNSTLPDNAYFPGH